MTDLRMIIREFAKGTPMREIERKLNLSRTSLRTYKERAEKSGKTMLELQSLEDAELHATLTRADARSSNRRSVHICSLYRRSHTASSTKSR